MGRTWPGLTGRVGGGGGAAMGCRRGSRKLETAFTTVTGEPHGVDEVPEQKGAQHWDSPRQRAERWAGRWGRTGT